MCARHGWAFAAYDEEGALVAAAKGRPPALADGIYGAELWGLFMAASSADPWAPLRVDCQSVQVGSQMGREWAAAPDRCLARVWAPLNAALDDDPQRVVWMPAHCSHDAVGKKRLGDGTLLSELDIAGNAFVDKLAKEAARADRLPPAQLDSVRKLGEKLTAVATWIGQVTQLANNFPDPRWPGAGRKQFLRDSEALGTRRKCKTTLRHSRGQHQQDPAGAAQLGHAVSIEGFAGHQQWEALRQRVCARELAQQHRVPVAADAPSSLAKLLEEQTVGVGGNHGARQPCKRRKPAAARQEGGRAIWPMTQPWTVADVTACEGGNCQGSLACEPGSKRQKLTSPAAQGASDQQPQATEL